MNDSLSRLRFRAASRFPSSEFSLLFVERSLLGERHPLTELASLDERPTIIERREP